MNRIAQVTLFSFTVLGAAAAGFAVLAHKHHGPGDLIFIAVMLAFATGHIFTMGLAKMAIASKREFVRTTDRLGYKPAQPIGQETYLESTINKFTQPVYARTVESEDFKQLSRVLGLSVRECATALKVPDVVIFGLGHGRYVFDGDVARALLVKFSIAKMMMNRKVMPDFSDEGKLVSDMTAAEIAEMRAESEADAAVLERNGGWHGDGEPTQCGTFSGYEIREPGKTELSEENNHERYAREGKYD